MKRWQRVVAILIIYLLGVGSGIALTGIFVAHRVTHPRPIPETSLRFMARRLLLDAEQRALLRPILVRTRDRLDEVQGDIEGDVRGILRESEQEIREMLRPEQQRRFDRMIERRRALRRRTARE